MPKQDDARGRNSVFATSEGLRIGPDPDKQTLRQFDAECLTPLRVLTPAEIRAMREKAGVSQAVFARYLNVSVGLVSQWESGYNQPRGPALKLLSLIAQNGLSAVA